MEQKLVQYYEFVESVAGREAKVKLAQMTCLPSVVAKGKPDDPALLELFRKAIPEITGRNPPPRSPCLFGR